jgi:hypothetical protein
MVPYIAKAMGSSSSAVESSEIISPAILFTYNTLSIMIYKVFDDCCLDSLVLEANYLTGNIPCLAIAIINLHPMGAFLL